jgi:hypothetical protein
MVKLANPPTAWWLSSMMIDNDGHRIDALRCRGAHHLSGDVTAKTLLLRARQNCRNIEKDLQSRQRRRRSRGRRRPYSRQEATKN